MLFNSQEFLFFFLPIVILGFFQIAMRSPTAAATWLTFASLFFYGWWNVAFLPLLVLSIIINFFFGRIISCCQVQRTRNMCLAVGVMTNLLLLIYYKYTGFLMDILRDLLKIDLPMASVTLPLGISFFTFTQIAFLVDAYRGLVREPSFLHYGLFVSYFPHLIAGPVLHHGQMMPQFRDAATYQINYAKVANGLSLFVLGLGKKVLLADSFARYASPMFTAAHQGVTPDFIEAWIGALAYTLQLYFDFSGYSDMAVGLSRLFGIELPINFNSPYKAHNIIDFWRRWHISLSTFLRDYLYIALGGNRYGSLRRHANLFTTMFLGGLWHGAGWTYVLWGSLHGAFLIVNHGWRSLRRILITDLPAGPMEQGAAAAITFLAVVGAWVVFRSPTLAAAQLILTSMLGLTHWLPASGPSTPVNWAELDWGACAWIACGLGIVWLFPNSQAITSGQAGPLSWQPSKAWAFGIALMLTGAVIEMSEVSEFLYFQF